MLKQIEEVSPLRDLRLVRAVDPYAVAVPGGVDRPGLAESSDELLQAGMTFVVHAAYDLPDSGAMFVPLGDVCHVTSQGPELLMEFPRTPFIAGR